ncbi:MAG: GNAT family N-acetyltransferase [Planctomycetota bacterium]|jgi:GNAT superfamily N-acetyltransferase
MLEVYPVDTDEDIEIIRSLFVEYADFLKNRFGDYVDPDWAGQFRQRFEDEVNGLPGRYAPPDGCLLLAAYEGEEAGCVALRKLSEGICEMRRLFVSPRFRGLGLGRALGQAVIEQGRRLGYNLMRLETNRLLEAATGLYASLGFKETTAYEVTPVPKMLCMELKL